MDQQEHKPKERQPLFIPKSLGIGWTLNFENPYSYLIVAVLILVIAYRLLHIMHIINF